MSGNRDYTRPLKCGTTDRILNSGYLEIIHNGDENCMLDGFIPFLKGR